MPADFYKDELYFRDPEDLKEIFHKLEENNLKMIHEQQEQAENYEILLEREHLMRASLERDRDEHNKAKLELLAKIEIAQNILQILKKNAAIA